ncbi:MAG: galactose-1-phosphate uridylyltransferase [Terriglobales bacterium]
MSELRWNPLLGEWVITATQRQDRTFQPPAGFCPLCPTRPGAFQTEIPRPDFDIAVFENKFPSLRRQPPPPAVRGSELAPVAPAAGICEVVVYSPRHDGSMATEPPEHIARLVAVWQDRFQELSKRRGIRYVLIFENKGAEIGVTLSHPHGQIYAFPFVPPIPRRELTAMRRHWRRTGRCLLCDMLRRERRARRRVVFENAAWTALLPFSARYPYELNLLPRRHCAAITDLQPREVAALADGLRAVTAGYDRLFGFSLPYMMLLHQRPTGRGRWPEAHLHFEFLPPHRTANKLKYLAGCESGAGTFINDTLPEESAARLRAAIAAAGT